MSIQRLPQDLRWQEVPVPHRTLQGSKRQVSLPLPVLPRTHLHRRRRAPEARERVSTFD